MGDSYHIAGGTWQIAELTDLKSISLTQGELKNQHVDDISTEIIYFQAPVFFEWNFNLNPRLYIYLINLLYLPGFSAKVKHAIMRRLLRHARLMKSHLPMEARRYV